MRNYLLVILLALQCFSLRAEDKEQIVEYFENEESFVKDDAGQKRELLELLLLRERVIELNMDWHNDPLSDVTLSKNIATFIKLKSEMDTLSNFAWRYGMLLRKKTEDESVITGHNRFVVLKISDAFSILSRKISEVTSLYYPKDKKLVKSDDFLSRGTGNEAKAHTMWLSAHLTTFDAFLKAYNGFFRNKHTRNLIKDLARAKEGKDVRLDEVAAVAKHTLGKSSRRWMQKALGGYASSRNQALSSFKDEELARLVGTIESNESAVDLYNDADFNIRYYRMGDGLGRLLSWVVDAASGLFGNIAGRFRFRKGHMYDHDEYRIELKKRLRPLDILMEKTPFALTDTFIPGHYGHAAIYLGTEEQLREVGMWNHPVIIPHQADIRNGKVIAEALRPGVWLNTLEEFLNIDELTLYRQPNVQTDRAEMARIYERTLAQLGKDYDFNFDVNTLDKIVCSELIYHAFGTINWPVKYVLGRPTISPDNLAEVAYSQNGPISFILGNRAEERFVPDPVDKLDIADKLSLIQLEDGNFGKETRRCRDVHEQNGELRRVCYGRVEALIYKAPNESIYDNQIKAAQAL
tara:strand:+ start:59751 stop:61487 length:1737 start_codon:yes stop_codon:yes gene_type:complete